MYRLYKDTYTHEYIITTKPFSIRSHWCSDINRAIHSIQNNYSHFYSLTFSERQQGNNLQLIIEFDCLNTFYDKYPELFI